MADYNPSVALGVNAPDPQGGLKSISGILGLGQQGLDIKASQLRNQSLQAKATMDQQSAKENQNLAQLISDPVGSGIAKPDGTPTDNAKNLYMKAAPTTWGQHYDNLVSAATKKVQFNSAINDLRTSERAELASAAGGAATRAESPDDINTTLDNLVESKKGTPEEANYRTIAGTMKEAISHLATQTNGGNPPPPGQEPWRNGALKMVSSILPASSTVGPGGVALPGAATTGAGAVNRDLIHGGLTPPPGAAPGSAINPTPPQVAGATKRQTETGNADVDTSNTVVAAQRDARTNIDLTKRIDQLADVVQPGAIASKVSQGLGALGLSDVNQARTELQKDLGKLQTSASSRAGSDERARTILSGLPTDTTPTQTIHQAMDFARGSARQDLALGQLREKNSAATKGQMNGFQGDYAHATAAASPLMHEYHALSPQDQVGFFQRNFKTKEEAKAFRAQAESVKKLSPDVIGQ
jgi:hypothetical protein